MAGQPVEVAAPGPDLPRVCRSAALLVVEDSAVEAVASVAGPERPDVVVVSDHTDLVETWRAAVRVGARHVVTLPGGAAELLDVLALINERPGAPGPMVGVIGGRGGAGASTLAVALGWAFARRDHAVMLVDLDFSGGGLDLAVGLEQASGLRWPDLSEVQGVVASSALREQLPSVDGMTVLAAASRSAGMDSPHPLPDGPAVSSVIDAGRRGGGVVVADLPRCTAAPIDAVVAACTVLLLVVPADVRAVAAATAVASRVQNLCNDVRTVVRLEARSRLRERDVVTALGFSHAATLRAESGVTAATDRAQLLAWLRRARMGRTAKSLADSIMRADDGLAL
jgi:secretion/DNA translocation related CpaE-like protein